MRLHRELGVRVVDRVAVLVREAVDRLHEEPATTGLVALAPVRAAPVGVVRKEAPPAFRHALRAVHERLDLDAGRFRDPRRLGERAFAGEHHAGRALRLEEGGGG